MNNEEYQLKEKILSLQAALLSQHPTLPILLREIWQTLRSNPDNVTLLSEEDIGTIVSGLKQQTATEITTAAPKKVSTKSLKGIVLEDL